MNQIESRIKIRSLGCLGNLLLGLSLQFSSVCCAEEWKCTCVEKVVFCCWLVLCLNLPQLRFFSERFVLSEGIIRHPSRYLRGDALIRGKNEVDSSHESSHDA